MRASHTTPCILLILCTLVPYAYGGPGGGGAASGYVEVFGLDTQAATYNVGSNVILQDLFCVISSSNAGGTGTPQNWNIYGDTVISPFELLLAGETNIPMSIVEYQGRIGGAYAAWTTLATAEPATFDYDGYLSADCGDNANMRVQVNDASLQSARAGTWVGQIALTARTDQRGKPVTATGTWQVEVTVPNLIEVSGLADISASWSGTGDQQNTQPFCIYTNSVSQTAGVRFDSLNGNGQFLLQGVATAATIPYTIEFDNAGAGTTWQGATEGVGLSAQDVAGGILAAGGGCANVQFRLTALASALSGAETDSYADTITITVTPI